MKEGEIFGFLGPSGAGKTTTIKLLTRQLRPGAGEIAVFGAPIARLDSTAYEQIGILSDNSGVYERMSIYENMKLFADLRGLPASRIGEVLEKVGLADAGKRVAKKLSKGMRQRLILAMAVLHRPRLLFLDEPTAALDPATTAAIHRLLREMNDGRHDDLPHHAQHGGGGPFVRPRGFFERGAYCRDRRARTTEAEVCQRQGARIAGGR